MGNPAFRPAAGRRPDVLPEMRIDADRAFDSPAQKDEKYPTADLLPLLYHARRVRGSHVSNLNWTPPRFAMGLPRLLLTLPPEDFEALNPRARKPKTGGPAPVVVIPAQPVTAAKPGRWPIVASIAAGLFVGLVLWGGANAVRIGSGTAVINRDASAPDGPDSVALADAQTPVARPGAGPGAPAAPGGPAAWVRKAVARRAAVDLTDSFRGMEAWGMAAKTWAPGWSRHPDGYVRTGQLALFNPSKDLRNYRLEFFAQIESKSIGWAVRARDRRNYYAMKFTVVEPGLRPVIAMVHYSVIDGKAGRRTEIPLSMLMVHDREPYRVSVEVKGDRVVTSVEGQEVDSWRDNKLASGGIGFFSEAGERARLYWMKVAVNQDFLGRICAYLAGGTEAVTVAAALPAAPGRRAPYDPAAPVGAVAALPIWAGRRKRTWAC